MDIDDVSAMSGRDPSDVTRRDVARALLSVPAEQALAALAEVRQELTRRRRAGRTVRDVRPPGQDLRP